MTLERCTMARLSTNVSRAGTQLTSNASSIIVTLQEKPIKVEIIGEPLPAYGLMNPNKAQAQAAPQPSLIERLGMIGSALLVSYLKDASPVLISGRVSIQGQQTKKGPRPSVAQLQQQNARAIQQQAYTQANLHVVPLDNERRPRKKGPKRIQKARAAHFVQKRKSAAQLDAEIEDYRKSAPKLQPPSSP